MQDDNSLQGPQHTVVLRVRFPLDEYERLKALALTLGQSVSGLLRLGYYTLIGQAAQSRRASPPPP